MKLGMLLTSGCVGIAMALFALPAPAAVGRACTAGTPAAAYSTEGAQQDANHLIKGIQVQARQATYYADMLRSFATSPGITWQVYGDQLNWVRTDVNRIGDKVCSLENIRSAVTPHEQRVIDGIAGTTTQMATNTQKAIQFINAHQGHLWVPAYRNTINNLDNEAHSLTHFVDRAVKSSLAS
jgi:hypothetical protein